MPKIIHICLVEVIFMFFRLQNLEINQHLVYWSLVASGLSVRKKCGFTKPENEEIGSPVIGDQFCTDYI